MSSIGAFLSGVSASAISASLAGGPVLGGGTILMSYYRAYGVTSPILAEDAIFVGVSKTYGVLGMKPAGEIMAHRANTYAIWSP